MCDPQIVADALEGAHAVGVANQNVNLKPALVGAIKATTAIFVRPA